MIFDSEWGWAIIVIAFFIAILGGSVIYDNWSEKESCRVMEEAGYDTKIVDKKIIFRECMVKDDALGKFIPYDKFRGIGGD